MTLMALTRTTALSGARAAQFTNDDLAFIVACGTVIVILVLFVLMVAWLKK